MLYEQIQSQVSYASYQKATDVQTGGTCCLCGEEHTEPIVDYDCTNEMDGTVVCSTVHIGYEPLCYSCEIILADHAPEEVTQIPPMSRIYYSGIDGHVMQCNDDDLPF